MIFAAEFLATALIFAVASLFLTQKAIDIVNATTKFAKYVVSFLVSGLITFGSKLIGVGAVFSVLVGVGYDGNLPTVAPEAGWPYFILLFIMSWAVSGGWYDWRKKLAKEGK